MFDGLGNLLCLTCKLSEHILRPRVGGVNLKLLLEFLLGLLHERTFGIGLRKQQASQAKVDANGTGIVLQYPLVLRRSLVPFALNLQRLGVELMSLVGSRRCLRQLLRSAQRKI